MDRDRFARRFLEHEHSNRLVGRPVRISPLMPFARCRINGIAVDVQVRQPLTEADQRRLQVCPGFAHRLEDVEVSFRRLLRSLRLWLRATPARQAKGRTAVCVGARRYDVCLGNTEFLSEQRQPGR